MLRLPVYYNQYCVLLINYKYQLCKNILLANILVSSSATANWKYPVYKYPDYKIMFGSSLLLSKM